VNEINILYVAMFGLMSMAIFLFLGFGRVMKQSAQDASDKRRKKKSYRPQGKLSRRLEALQVKQRALIEQSPLPGSIYSVLTVACAVGGFFVGRVVFSSLFLSVIIGVLALLVPMIVLSFRQSKSKSKRLNRLASSMMILSNSYLVTEDFITTVKDNLAVLECPEPFRDFLTYATMMDSDVRSALRRMENKVNNLYFSQWIDALVLAQDDRSLRYVAVSVVDSMHDVLQAQDESDAAMYAVWREYLITLALIFSVPLVFKLLMHDAYVTMTTSFVGQGLMVLLLLAVVFSVFKAIKINRPLMM
jgi:uncharacterized membrane protein